MSARRAFPFGPTPGDFKAAFRVGGTARRIHPVDACGVMLAAIQGLHELTLEEEKHIRELRAALRALRKSAAKRR